MIGLAGIYPQNWPRVCAALNTVAKEADAYLTDAESRDDCYRSYYAALAEMARR